MHEHTHTHIHAHMHTHTHTHTHISDTVSGVCYVPQMRVLWISAGTSTPNFYEPKSGENVCYVMSASMVCLCPIGLRFTGRHFFLVVTIVFCSSL